MEGCQLRQKMQDIYLLHLANGAILGVFVFFFPLIAEGQFSLFKKKQEEL